MFRLGSDMKQKVMGCATCYFPQSEQSSEQETSLEMKGDTCRKGSKCVHEQNEKMPLIHTLEKARDL